MISLGFEKKVAKIGMKIIDQTIGKRFPIIDEITDVFQEQDKRFKEMDREIEAIKSILKDQNG